MSAVSVTPKINYVIATHALAYKNRIRTDPYSQYVLRYNMYILSKLLTPDSFVRQVTIVAPEVVDDLGYYYNISPYDTIIKEKGIDVVVLPVKNKGISYTQYIRCFQKFNNEFDYHIIMEDDWTLNLEYTSFDKLLVEYYTKRFPKELGFLDCWSPSYPNRFVGSSGGLAGAFHSAITLGILNKSSITKLLEVLPETEIDNLTQLSFSYTMTNNGINICDLSTAGFPNRILFWETVTGEIKDYSDKRDVGAPLYVPVQYYYDSIKYKNMTTRTTYTVTNSFGIHTV